MTDEALPAVPTPRLSGKRWIVALTIAAVSDTVSVFAEVTPPIQWAVDVATALALFAVVGRRWALLPAFIAEAIPGVAAIPTWVLVVGSMAVGDHMKRPPSA